MNDKTKNGTLSKYKVDKEKARQEAIDWQFSFSDKNYSASELIVIYGHFITIGRRYGLLKEFRENGII